VSRRALLICGAILVVLATHAGANLPAQAQITKLPHEGTPGDFFGAAVSISGNVAVVGAPSEDNCGPNSGAAYVFRRDANSGVWHRAARLESPVCEPGALFGRSVAATHGTVIVASGGEFFADERAAAAHVFSDIPGEGWQEFQRLSPSEQGHHGLFAADVSAHGNRILVVSTGDRIGGRFRGTAYVYERSADDRWVATASIEPVSRRDGAVFARKGDIFEDRIIVAASHREGPLEGAAFVFEFDSTSGTWLQRANPRGYSRGDIVVSVSGTHAILGDHSASRGRGHVHLLQRDSEGAWESVQRLDPYVSGQSGAFGTSVAVRGSRALVVGYDEQLDVESNIDRVVFVFQPDAAGHWHQRHVIDIGEVSFGAAIALDDRDAIIGSTGDDIPGAAYVVRLH
jgi:hypothetical protein